MKKFACLAIVFLFTTVIARAQMKELASFSPEKPKIGDKISVKYNAAFKSAALRGAKDVTLETYIIREDDTPLLIETPMKVSLNTWSCSMQLKDEKARFVYFRFVSGEKNDANGDEGWSAVVFGKDGKPLKGSMLSLGQAYRSGGSGDFKHVKDLAKARAAFKEEQKLFPANWAAYTSLWSLMLRETPGDETKATVKKELEAMYTANASNLDAVTALLPWFDQTDQKDRGKKIREELIAKDPKGKVAESARSREAYAEKDPAKAAEKMEQFLKEFPQKEKQLENYSNALVGMYSRAGNQDKAAEILASMKHPNGSMYNTIAWACIEKGENLEKAVYWAKKGIALLRKNDPATKPSYMSTANWKWNNEYSLGMILDTYACGLVKLNKPVEALPHYAEAFSLTKGKQSDINANYVDGLLKAGQAKRANEIAIECLRTGKSDTTLLKKYRESFIAVHGSESGFDKSVADARDYALNQMKKKLTEERLNKPLIDFNLKGLDGQFVKLSDLKGKVVVIDFWATWCGPCKASFPYLQQVYNKYKHNENVRIYALDTWENESGQKKYDLVTKFIADNKYTFPVLYDESDIVTKYGVSGIPTKFVIDREGKIQFQSIGFSGGQEMLDELTLQIEMLLGDEFYSMK